MNRSCGGFAIVAGFAVVSALGVAMPREAEASERANRHSSKATQALEVVTPGRYEVRVFVDGSPLTGVRLVDEMDNRFQGAWSTPSVYPAGGLEQVTVLDRQDEPIASFYLHLSPGSVSVPAKEAVRTNDSAPVESGAIKASAATIPALSNRSWASMQRMEGERYARVTAYDLSGAVAQNVRILVRAPGGAVLRTGERRRVAKIDLDGKAQGGLVLAGGVHRLGSVATMPLGNPKPVNASCFEFTVAYYKQPWKKVEKWDEYRMVKDRLKYVGSAKRVSYGAHAWAFDPSTIPERGNTGSLFGYKRGWQWENAERSPVFPGRSGGQP